MKAREPLPKLEEAWMEGAGKWLRWAGFCTGVHVMACTSEPTTEPCPDGQVADGGSCVPEACGTGTWGALPLDGRTVYVDGSAAEGGDGSAEAPFHTIHEGADAAGAAGGGLVAIAAGTYVENVVLTGDHDGVHLAGRCRELVTVDGSGGNWRSSTVLVDTGLYDEIAVSGMTVAGGPFYGVLAFRGALDLHQVTIESNTGGGLMPMSRAQVTAREVVVRGTTPFPNGTFGRGISVQSGASLVAESCTVEDNHEFGVFAFEPGTAVTLVDTAVRGTVPSPDSDYCWGIEVNSGATLTAESCIIEDNHELGIRAMHSGTVVTLRDTVVEYTTDTSSEDVAYGAAAVGGASLIVESCTLDGSHGTAVFASDHGTSVELRDTEIRDTMPYPGMSYGTGIKVGFGASLASESCQVVRAVGIGILAQGAGTTVTMLATAVHDTAPAPDGGYGWGVAVLDGATLSAESVTIAGSHEVGVTASESGTVVSLHDTVVSDTTPPPGSQYGVGIDVRAGATLEAESCTIEGSHEAGMVVHGPGTAVTLRETTVRDTILLPDGHSGRGISVEDGAALSAESCLVENNHEVGVHATGPDTVVELLGTTIADTRSLPGEGRGYGVEVIGGATLVAESCTIASNHASGLHASDPSTSASLADTTIRGTLTPSDGTTVRAIAMSDGAAVTLESCAISDNHGPGIEVVGGATLVATTSVIERNQEAGVLARHQGTVVDMRETAVRDTAQRPGGTFGLGLQAHDGAGLFLRSSTVERNHYGGVLASDPGTRVELVDTEVLGTRRAVDTSVAFGVLSQRAARIVASGLTVGGTEGPGLRATSHSALSCTECQIDGNTFAGAVVDWDAALSLHEATITGNGPDSQEGGGVGVFAEDSDIFGNTLVLTDTVITAHPLAAVFLRSQGSYLLVDNDLTGGTGVVLDTPLGSRTFHGDSVFAMGGIGRWDGEDGLLLVGNSLHEGETGVFLHGATATLVDNTWAGNTVDVWRQACDGMDPVNGDLTGLSTRMCPLYDHAVLDDIGLSIYLEDVDIAE